MNAQINIGYGTETDKSIPIEPYYGYTYSQVIYLASEINISGNITGVKYFATTNTSLYKSSEWDVYIGHTSKSSFTDRYDWIPITDLTPKHSGTVSINNGEVTVTFSTPFVYNGTDNLVIAVDENQSGYDSYSDDFYCSSTSTSRSISYHDDMNNTNPISPPSGTISSAIANIQLQGINESCPVPSNFLASNVTSNTLDLTWTENGTSSMWDIEYGTSGFTRTGIPTISGLNSNSFNLTNLSASTTYDFYIRSNCKSGDKSFWAGPYTFITACSDDDDPYNCISQVEVKKTIFIADYENNETNSGFMDVNPTNAPADDAVYMVPNPGNGSNFAVAHKVDRTNTQYMSNGSYRSESDAMRLFGANFLPGDHFRYEFSFYLKDWEASGYVANIFQMKETAGGNVTRIAVRGNKLVSWDANGVAGTKVNSTLIDDILAYKNEWIDFTIDVLWTKESIGYIKYYIRPPGHTSYTLVRSVENIPTYFGTGTGGNRGYFKWGVYRGDTDLNSWNDEVIRTVYHDNIRVHELEYSSLGTETINEREDLSISVYPNPTNGNITIHLPITINNADIYIYSLEGKALLKKQLRGNEEFMISISHLNSGVYYLKVEHQGGSVIEKIIKN